MKGFVKAAMKICLLLGFIRWRGIVGGNDGIEHEEVW